MLLWFAWRVTAPSLSSPIVDDSGGTTYNSEVSTLARVVAFKPIDAKFQAVFSPVGLEAVQVCRDCLKVDFLGRF